MSFSDLDSFEIEEKVVPDEAPWEPQAGSQTDVLETREYVDELFIGGGRGTGKTDTLLGDYAMDVPKYGRHWRGIIFRRTLSQFREIIDRSKEMYLCLFPGAIYKETSKTWHFPNGAKLHFFHMEKDSDADKHLGIQYQWMGWDELPHWPTPTPYRKLKACRRSKVKGIPMRIRSTGNPGGVGLGWIKSQFNIPDDVNDRGGVPYKDSRTGWVRMFIRGYLEENQIMLDATPGYVGTLHEATEGNEQLMKAWVYGDFNIFFGKYFTMFNKRVHCVSPEKVLPGGMVPDHWKLYGSLDYGEAQPTSFGLWAKDEQGISYRIAEYYKGGLWPDEHAAGIKSLWMNCPYTKGRKPSVTFADGQIFHLRANSGKTAPNRYVSDIFRREAGIYCVAANKERIPGWRLCKNLLAWKQTEEGVFSRYPQIYYFPECVDFEREMENAVHAGDEDSPLEDLNTDSSDHSLDDFRYYAMGALYTEKPKKDMDSMPTMGIYKTWKNQRESGTRDPRESFVVIPKGKGNVDDILQGWNDEIELDESVTKEQSLDMLIV